MATLLLVETKTIETDRESLFLSPVYASIDHWDGERDNRETRLYQERHG